MPSVRESPTQIFVRLVLVIINDSLLQFILVNDKVPITLLLSIQPYNKYLRIHFLLARTWPAVVIINSSDTASIIFTALSYCKTKAKPITSTKNGNTNSTTCYMFSYVHFLDMLILCSTMALVTWEICELGTTLWGTVTQMQIWFRFKTLMSKFSVKCSNNNTLNKQQLENTVMFTVYHTTVKPTVSCQR